jgi:hypothetical protein
MALNVCWIGVQDGRRETVLDRLGFEEFGEVGDEIGADYACAESPNGWLICTATDRSFDMDEALAKVSSDGLAVGCEMSESAMVSRALGFEGGNPLWSVVRDPDKDGQDLVVEGVPPPQLNNIRQRLQAAEAAPGNENVDYLFDAPMELAENFCGYRAGRASGLEWAALRKKVSNKNQKRPRRPKSLSALMRGELLPLLQSLGWRLVNDPPSLSDPGEIVREVGRLNQTLWFDFGSGQETYIIVHFDSWEGATHSGYFVAGYTRDAPARRPLWKLLTWKHFREATRRPDAADDPIRATIDKAKGEILAVDTFLKTDTLAPCIYYEVSRSG